MVTLVVSVRNVNTVRTVSRFLALVEALGVETWSEHPVTLRGTDQSICLSMDFEEVSLPGESPEDDSE